MAFTALFDANVLYPAPLRDLLLQLAMTKLFRARWTNTIHEEWIRIAKKVRPDIPSAKLDNLRKLMDAHAEDCLVTDFEPLIENLALPDPDDRHVLAAAIKGRADVIVTSNLKHFPEDELNTYDLNAQHPDVFIRHLIDLEPDAVADSARIVRVRLKNPPVSVDRYLETLLQQGLVETVSELRSFHEVL